MDFEKDYIAAQKKLHTQDTLYSFFTKRISLWSNYSSIWWMIPISIPICLILSIKDGIKKICKKKHKWSVEKADKCCYAISQYILVKDENNDYICYVDGDGFSRYKLRFLPRRFRKYACEFNLKLFSYFVNNFKLEGYTKIVHFDSFECRYEITFTKKEKEEEKMDEVVE